MAADRRSWAAFLTGTSTGAPSPVPPSDDASDGDGAADGGATATRPRPRGATRPAPTGTRRLRPVTAPVAPPVGPPAAPPGALPPPGPPAGMVPPAAVPAPESLPPGSVLVVEEDLEADPLVDPRYDLDDRNWVRYRPSRSGLVRTVLFVVLALASVLWVRAQIYAWIDRQIDPGGEPGGVVEFTIPDGATTNDVASDLAAAGVVSNATVFRYWLRCDGDISIVGFLSCDTEHTFKAGDYELRENMSFEEAVAVLDAGPIPEVVFTVTVPEGLRWTEMVDRLVAENPRFERDELEAAFTDPSVTSEFLPPDVPFGSMEGLLFPATYDIPEDQLGDEQRFLQRMAAEFDRRFSALLDDPGPAPVIEQLGLRPYDVVIVASLVEEEAKIDADRPRIARVIYNRLLAGERLGIDATACYAANKPCSELTAADLENPSPWNTRAVSGLPPTPIAAPGEASLRAALQPAEGDWFWYVLTDEGGVPGAHTFATTESEFTAAVAVCREKGYCG